MKNTKSDPKDCWDISPLQWATVPTADDDGLEWTVLDADGKVLEDWPSYLRQLVMLRDQVDTPINPPVCVWCRRLAHGLYVDAEHDTVDAMCTDCGAAREAKLEKHQFSDESPACLRCGGEPGQDVGKYCPRGGRKIARIPALDAAKYLLTLDNPDDGDLTSNLKLQKLLYYGQGVHLALYDKPLFPERIEAWMHGPVIPPVFHYYRRYAGVQIPTPDRFDPKSLPKKARDVLDEVHTVFGQFSAWRLREMTHDEPPWRNNYREGVRGIQISHADLKTYFKTITDI